MFDSTGFVAARPIPSRHVKGPTAVEQLRVLDGIGNGSLTQASEVQSEILSALERAGLVTQDDNGKLTLGTAAPERPAPGASVATNNELIIETCRKHIRWWYLSELTNSAIPNVAPAEARRLVVNLVNTGLLTANGSLEGQFMVRIAAAPPTVFAERRPLPVPVARRAHESAPPAPPPHASAPSPSAGRPPPSGARITGPARTRGGRAQEAADYVAAHPGTHAGPIASHMSVSDSYIHHILGQAEHKKLIVRRGSSGSYAFYPADANAPAAPEGAVHAAPEALSPRIAAVVAFVTEHPGCSVTDVTYGTKRSYASTSVALRRAGDLGHVHGVGATSARRYYPGPADVAEEPGAKEPGAEEPGAEEPVAEEPVAEEIAQQAPAEESPRPESGGSGVAVSPSSDSGTLALSAPAVPEPAGVLVRRLRELAEELVAVGATLTLIGVPEGPLAERLVYLRGAALGFRR